MLQAKLFDNCIGAFNDGRSAAWAGATLAGCPYREPMGLRLACRPSGAARAPWLTLILRTGRLWGQLFDTISDEIEIARAAKQVAANLVDQATMEALAPAPRHTQASRIGAMDLLPLQILLSRHVASLEEILETFNAL